MENPFCFLVTDKGCYTVVVPNPELQQFQKTNQAVKAHTVVPFGFSFPFQHAEMILNRSNQGLKEEEVEQKAFKKFVDTLYNKLAEAGADYVLLDEIACGNLDTTTFMVRSPQCQFFVSVPQHSELPTRYSKGVVDGTIG